MPRKNAPAKNSEANRNRSVPGKLTPAVLAEICHLYAQGLTLRSACHRVGVTTVSFHEHRRNYPEFEATQWAKAEVLNTCKLEEKAFELALSSDNRSPTMLIFMLKARLPHKYRDNVAVQHSGVVEFAQSFAGAMSKVVGAATEIVRH